MMEINKEKLLLNAPKERYEQQLNDVRWKFKSDNIRIRDKHECRLCGAKKTQLDVHHIRYISGREAWDYDDGDLVTLCHSCHENLHKEETKAPNKLVVSKEIELIIKTTHEEKSRHR